MVKFPAKLILFRDSEFTYFKVTEYWIVKVFSHYSLLYYLQINYSLIHYWTYADKSNSVTYYLLKNEVCETYSNVWVLFVAEALHLAHLIAAHGYLFPIDDHILTVKNDNTYYRFQVRWLSKPKLTNFEFLIKINNQMIYNICVKNCNCLVNCDSISILIKNMIILILGK